MLDVEDEGGGPWYFHIDETSLAIPEGLWAYGNRCVCEGGGRGGGLAAIFLTFSKHYLSLTALFKHYLPQAASYLEHFFR
jgi:hypothetical protein